MDKPEQLKLFETHAAYTVECLDEPSGCLLWSASYGETGPLTYEQAVQTVHQMAEVMAANGTVFTNIITAEGRMYGEHNGERVVIQIKSEMTYIYP